MTFLKVIDGDWISKWVSTSILTPGSGPCLPSQDVRHVEADRKALPKRAMESREGQQRQRQYNKYPGSISPWSQCLCSLSKRWFLRLAGWFDFDVVTVIPIVGRPTFDFAQSHPHRKMVSGADCFLATLATVFSYTFGIFKMETENAAFVEEILAWRVVIFCFHLQIQGCTYLFFFFSGWRVTTGGLKWLWVGTIPILALVAGFPALCPGAELLTVSGVWSDQGILTFLGRNLQYMRHLPGS